MANTTATTNDIVTIVRDPYHTLGKTFAADGSKKSNVMVSIALAVQRHVPTATAMAAVIKEVSEDTHAAIINASFPAISVGEQFVILSERQFAKLLGIKERSKMAGVHTIKLKGTTYKTIGRFKENVKPSNWQILDRDVDACTPPEFAKLNYVAWLAKMELLLPGLATATRISTLSTSARVTLNGQVLGQGNGHTWVQFQDAGDVERVRIALKIRAMEMDLSWLKSRFSRSDRTQVVGQSVTTIVDPSVWTPGRLVFNGKPTVASNLKVKPQKTTIHEGTRLDTSLLKLPDAKRIQSITRAAGQELKLRTSNGNSLAVDAQDLLFTTEIELVDGTITTVQEALTTLEPGAKLRCQTPFRESVSMAAFLSRGGNGKPFIHDVGTSTTHWLSDQDAATIGCKPLAHDGPPFAEVMAKLSALSDGDLAAQWSDEVLHLASNEIEQIKELVKTRTKQTLRVLNAKLADARKSIKTEAKHARAAGRKQVLFTPEDITALAAQTEALIVASVPEDQYLSFGGILSQVRDKEIPYTHLINSKDQRPPKVPLLEPLDEVAIRAKVESVAVFHTAKGENIAVPKLIIETLIEKKVHAAPIVNGLVTHPIVMFDGTIIALDGLHKITRLFLRGAALDNVKPYSQAQAKQALKRLQLALLEGFEFESPMDAMVALCALLTGVERRILDMAPGFAFFAPIQSSGKTTLARIIHIILTGRDMPAASFPEGDEIEMQKRLLSMLLASPAMVCFDNITDGITFQSSSISRAMTAPVFTQRVLGLSRDADCPTNVLFVLTGNNLSLGSDELTRWLPCYLNSKSARPQERTFKNSDVVSHALSIRNEVLRDVVGIVAGYIASKETMPTASRFFSWDRMVRQPLIWAGGLDVAKVFTDNMDKGESTGATLATIKALAAIMGEKRFTATRVAADLTMMTRYSNGGNYDNLKEALMILKAKNPESSSSVGRALKSIVNRRVVVDQRTLVLKSSKIDGISQYWIEEANP